MTINRYYEMILSDVDFRALVNYIDLNEYDCMYQAIDVDIVKYPEFEDEDIDILYRLFISEERLDDLLENIDSMIWEMEDDLGYSATIELRTLRAEMSYE